MPRSAARRTALAVRLDLAILAVGLAVAVPSLTSWLRADGVPSLAGLISMVLIVVMSRFPLVLTHRSGDVVIGFETCTLVFLALSVPLAEALALWVLGTTIANATSKKAWRSRL